MYSGKGCQLLLCSGTYHDPKNFPSPVGSGIGAPTVGSGGSSKAFAVGLSPAPLVTFPTPASSNPAYGFPVPGFPANFS